MAATYSTGDTLPFRSRPTAVANTESAPSNAMMHRCRMVYAIAAHNRTIPYTAAGSDAVGFSPTHAVVAGTSDSQNKRCELAHRIPPLTCSVACSIWWWLFQ